MDSTTILMIRPVSFGFNEETAESNAFQHNDPVAVNLQVLALAEFDNMVDVLRENKVEVIVLSDTKEPHTPDSIFPNNWVSFHKNGQVFLYPMQAANRRHERRMDIIEYLKEKFTIHEINDLSYFEKKHEFLEGTGSMVLNRDFKIAYACLSPRTNADVLNEFCRISGYKQLLFNAFDEQNRPIYHTNVLMCLGEEFVVICFESIKDNIEKELLKASFEYTRKEIVEITMEQMNDFAGNMLEVKNKNDENLLIMSTRALKSLNKQQKDTLKKYCKIISVDIKTIENIGGGSARCMMAEVVLPRQI